MMRAGIHPPNQNLIQLYSTNNNYNHNNNMRTNDKKIFNGMVAADFLLVTEGEKFDKLFVGFPQRLDGCHAFFVVVRV
jgi:hypothetical protein